MNKQWKWGVAAGLALGVCLPSSTQAQSPFDDVSSHHWAYYYNAEFGFCACLPPPAPRLLSYTNDRVCARQASVNRKVGVVIL
jgi:hypothetical protein